MLQECQIAPSSHLFGVFHLIHFTSELLPFQPTKGKAIPVILTLPPHRVATMNAAQAALKLHLSALSSLSGIVSQEPADSTSVPGVAPVLSSHRLNL